MHLTCRFMWGFFLQKKNKQTNKKFQLHQQKKKKARKFPLSLQVNFLYNGEH